MTCSPGDVGPDTLPEPLLSLRARLADAADDVTDAGRHDRLPVWVALGDDDVLRATLGIDAMCHRCHEPVRPYGPVSSAEGSGTCLHQHRCGAQNVPHEVVRDAAELLADDDQGSIDVRQVVVELLSRLYAEVTERRQVRAVEQTSYASPTRGLAAPASTER